jgi:signal transduction histidine kinase
VEAMGGEITLVSRQGFGTSFTVRIPPLHSR